jgi:hypothetical protein
MNTVCLDRERAEAVAYLKTRLLPDVTAGWPEAKWDVCLLDHLRRREQARLPFTPDRLPEIARLAALYDPAENEWDAEIAAEARAGRSLGASNAYCRRFLLRSRSITGRIPGSSRRHSRWCPSRTVGASGSTTDCMSPWRRGRQRGR